VKIRYLLVAAIYCSAYVVFADAPAPSPAPKAKAKVEAPLVGPSPEPIDIPAEPAAAVPDVSPTPVPTPLPVPQAVPSAAPLPLDGENEQPFHVDTMIGALMTVTGDTGTDVTPTFWIHVDGPLAFGNERSIGRLGARLGLSTAPGETFIIQDIKTWKAADVGVWGGRVVGKFGDVDTTVLVEGDFASRLKGSSVREPLNRLVRSAGVGLRFDHTGSNSSLTLLGGFDEATTSCDAGLICTGFHAGFAVMMYGQLALAKDAILLVGDVSLSMGAGLDGVHRRDILRIGLVLDPIQIARVFK
jgi:hypothetical protein